MLQTRTEDRRRGGHPPPPFGLRNTIEEEMEWGQGPPPPGGPLFSSPLANTKPAPNRGGGDRPRRSYNNESGHVKRGGIYSHGKNGERKAPGLFAVPGVPGVFHSNDVDDDDHYGEGRSYPIRTSSQSYAGAVKLCVIFVIIGWLGGFTPSLARAILTFPLDLASAVGFYRLLPAHGKYSSKNDEESEGPRPDFVYEHPYVSSSYYTSTKSIQTLLATEEHQVVRNLRLEAEEAAGMDPSVASSQPQTRLAIVRPFCEFDAEALPTTFTCWNALPPCKAASDDIGDADDEDLYEVSPQGELMAYRNNTVGRNLVGDRHLFDLDCNQRDNYRNYHLCHHHQYHLILEESDLCRTGYGQETYCLMDGAYCPE